MLWEFFSPSLFLQTPLLLPKPPFPVRSRQKLGFPFFAARELASNLLFLWGLVWVCRLKPSWSYKRTPDRLKEAVMVGGGFAITSKLGSIEISPQSSKERPHGGSRFILGTFLTYTWRRTRACTPVLQSWGHGKSSKRTLWLWACRTITFVRHRWAHRLLKPAETSTKNMNNVGHLSINESVWSQSSVRVSASA